MIKILLLIHAWDFIAFRVAFFLFIGKIFKVSRLFFCSWSFIYLFPNVKKQNAFYVNPKINCYVIKSYKFAQTMKYLEQCNETLIIFFLS